MNTITYIFSNRKADLKRLVVKYGLQPAKDDKDLWRKVNYLVIKFPSDFLKDIALIHPDRELILSTGISNPAVAEVSKDEKKSSACGCMHSGCDGKKDCDCDCKKSGVDGEEQKSAPAPTPRPKHEKVKELAPMLLIGLFVGGILIYTLQNVKS